MAGTTGIARYAQVTRIDKADKFFRFLIQLRVGAFRIGRIWAVPDFREAWADVRTMHRHDVERVVFAFVFRASGSLHGDITAVAIGAAEYHAGIGVHGVAVGTGMTTGAPRRFLVGVLHRLALGGRRMTAVFDVLRLLGGGNHETGGADHGQNQ